MGLYDDDPGTGAPAAGAPRSRHYEDDPGKPALQATETGKQQSEMGWPSWLGQGFGDYLMATGKSFSAGIAPRLDAVLDVAKGKGVPLPDPMLGGTFGWKAQPDYNTAIDARLKDLQERRERSPIATPLGDVSGGVAAAGAMAPAKIGAGIAGYGGGTVPARVAGYGTEGAIFGGVQGAGQTFTGKPEDYLYNAGKGAAVGGAINAALAPLIPKSAVTQRPGDPATGREIPVPPSADLKTAYQGNYKTLSQIPATYSMPHFARDLAAAEQTMLKGSAIPENATAVYRVMENLRNGAYGWANRYGYIGPTQIEAAGQALTGMKNTTGAGEKNGYAAGILRQTFDRFLVNAPQSGAVTSAPQFGQMAAEVAQTARGNYAAWARAGQVEAPLANAQRVERTKGTPVGDQLVSEGNRLLKTDATGAQPKLRGWTPETKSQLETAITPTHAEWLANLVGAKKGAVAAGVGGVVGGGTGAVGGIAGGPFGIATGGGVGSAVGSAVGGGLGRAAYGFGQRGLQNRWEEVAAAQRANSPLYRAQTQGSVPVAGPGMGPSGRAFVGATTVEGGTPYDDGREALVPSMMRQFTY